MVLIFSAPCSATSVSNRENRSFSRFTSSLADIFREMSVKPARSANRTDTQSWLSARGFSCAFSLAATAVQWGLEELLLLSPMLHTTSVYLGGTLLVSAGIYQLTPLKHACLRHCRSPLHFLASHWRKGRWGAFRMGLEHGLFCLGCCWVLMLLLFYGGVMSLWWIGGLALYVLVEKLLPLGHALGQYAGGLLIVLGLWVLVS